MNGRPAACLVAGFFLLAFGPARAAAWLPEGATWSAARSEAEITAGELTRVFLSGDVSFQSGDLRLRADRAEYDARGNTLSLDGAIHLVMPAGDVRAEEAFFCLDSGTGRTGEAVFAFPPLFGWAAAVVIAGPDELELRHGQASNCYHLRPPAAVAFEKLTVRPGESAAVRAARLKFFGRSFFYLPRYSYPLTEDEFREGVYLFRLTPRYGSAEGLQLYTSTTVGGGRERYRLDLDYRGRRGPAGGFTVDSTRSGASTLGFYYVDDRFAQRGRYRVEASHDNDFGTDGRSRLFAGYYRYSDELFLDDFFRRESRRRVHRALFYRGVTGDRGHVRLRLEAEPDRWFNETRYLPELAGQSFPRPLGPFYRQQSFQVTRLSGGGAGDGETVTRVHLAPELSLARPLAGGTARYCLSGGATFFSAAVDGGSALRAGGRAGVDLDWRFGRRLAGGLTHLVEPRLTLARDFVSRPPERFHQYDALDRAADDTLVTVGLVNRLTGPSEAPGGDRLRLDGALDYSLHRGEGDAFRVDFAYRPRAWLELDARAEYLFGPGTWPTALARVTWRGGPLEAGVRQAVHGRESNRAAPFFVYSPGRRHRFEGSFDYDWRQRQLESRELAWRRSFHCWEMRLAFYRDRSGSEVSLAFSPLFFTSAAGASGTPR